jgi:hypothetical protein
MTERDCAICGKRITVGHLLRMNQPICDECIMTMDVGGVHEPYEPYVYCSIKYGPNDRMFHGIVRLIDNAEGRSDKHYGRLLFSVDSTSSESCAIIIAGYLKGLADV